MLADLLYGISYCNNTENIRCEHVRKTIFNEGEAELLFRIKIRG